MADEFKRAARILSIDGGGIRGLIPAIFLNRLEADLGGSIADAFHLLAGTSTGGIIAVALAARKARNGSSLNPKVLVDLYAKHGPEIFDRSLLRSIFFPGGFTDELYSVRKLEQILRDLLGDATLKDIADSHLLVTSYDIERTKPHFFKNWRTGDPANDFLLRDVARATSAAPTYFEPALVANMNTAAQQSSDREHALVDGGVFANDPAMCAFAEAQRIYTNAESFVVLSAPGSWNSPLRTRMPAIGGRSAGPPA